MSLLSPSSDVGRLLRHPPLLLLSVARSMSELAAQIATVAIGWQVYQLTDSAFALGLVGLVQFAPSALLVFVAGHAADRYDRRRVLQLCQSAQGAAAAYLCARSLGGSLSAPEIFAVLLVFGVAGAFESPASAALLPAVAPEGMLQRATALSTGAWQVAAISGPAIGGLAYAVSPAAPYLVMVVAWLLAVLANGAIRLPRTIVADDPPTIAKLFAGIPFVWNNPAVLGTISLDLFAVLLGGATALLPIYAKDILHSGPWALGVMRAAPAVGALLMTAILTRHPLNHSVGLRMFQAVIAFGFLHRRVRGVAERVAVDCSPCRDGCCGRRQRRYPRVAGAALDTGRDARARQRRELPVHPRVEPAGRVRERHDGGVVRRDAGRAAGRSRDHPRRAAVDEAVSVATQRAAVGVSGPRLRCPLTGGYGPLYSSHKI
jgi:MFS family permease